MINIFFKEMVYLLKAIFSEMRSSGSRVSVVVFGMMLTVLSTAIVAIGFVGLSAKPTVMFGVLLGYVVAMFLIQAITSRLLRPPGPTETMKKLLIGAYLKALSGSALNAHVRKGGGE